MSNVYSPESPELKSSPALPHLYTCIEAVIRDAVRSGREEEPVRQFLRLHAKHFDGILNALHMAYHFTSTKNPAETSIKPPSNHPRPSLLSADEITIKQPSQWKDGVDWSKVEDDPDDDDDDDLAEDEDEKGQGTVKQEHVFSRRPYENLPHRGKKVVLTASDRLQQATTHGFPYPKTPVFGARVAVAQASGSDDGSDTPRQTVFNSSSLPLRQQPPPALASSAPEGAADQTSVSTDPEQAKLDRRLEKAREWLDGQASLGSPMADPNSSPHVYGNNESEGDEIPTDLLRAGLEKLRSDEAKNPAYQEALIPEQMEEAKLRPSNQGR